MQSHEPGVTGWSVKNRLVLLVLLPLAVVAAAVGVVAHDRQLESSAAEVVEGQVDGLRALIELKAALASERGAVELEFRSASFGIPARLGAGLLGLPDTETTFAVTDAAITASVERRVDIVTDLESAREERALLDPIAIDSYQALDDRIVAEVIGVVRSMQETGLATADADLADVLAQLEAAIRSSSAASNQTTRLAGAWFGPPETRQAAVSELGFATARFQMAFAELDTDRIPPDLLVAVESGDQQMTDAVLIALAGELESPVGTSFSSLPYAIEVFGASFERGDALTTIFDAATNDVEATASRIDTSAARSFRVALLAGGAAVALSILLSWRLAASISGPMLAVAERTRELRSGRIEQRPLPLSGPRELRDVAAALNDVAANLDSLESKLGALARADLDDPVLDERLPGRLGETLSRSVDTLSASVADRADLQTRLVREATHDSLTGLSNRAAALYRLGTALARSEEHTVGLLFVDLDDFKRANDLFGHRTGDLVLVEVAERLRAECRPNDLVARLGGDEFLIVVDDDPTLDGLMGLGRRVVNSTKRPLEEPTAGGLVTAASAGAALATGGSIEALAFLAQADAALYRAKASDDRLAVFDEQLSAEVSERASLEQRMRVALAGGDFEVHYQPILDAGSLEIDQVEALVRWTGPDSIGPDVFIPVAETSDLVIEIDRFVMGRATKDIAELMRMGVAPALSVAVNVSGRHLLHADFVRHVVEAIENSGIDPARLIVEVTETALVADLDRAALHLDELRSLGVRVSVDDFGTGFTSISQLKRLPIDELKIDKSLVDQLPHDQALVRVVRDLAEHFGMTTVAEGVETQEQADVLREVGCGNLQGWLYARAMSSSDLRIWLDVDVCVRAPDFL